MKEYLVQKHGIAEFAGLDNDGLENDRLKIGGLVPAASAAAVPQLQCREVWLLAPIEGFALVPCSHASCSEHG